VHTSKVVASLLKLLRAVRIITIAEPQRPHPVRTFGLTKRRARQLSSFFVSATGREDAIFSRLELRQSSFPHLPRSLTPIASFDVNSRDAIVRVTSAAVEAGWFRGEANAELVRIGDNQMLSVLANVRFERDLAIFKKKGP
jgi:hypothetical protein